MGFFLFFITNLGAHRCLHEKGCNVYISDLDNVEWNAFFEINKPYQITDKTKTIEFTDVVVFRPNDSMELLTNHRLMRDWHDYFCENFSFTPSCKSYIDGEFDKYLKGKEEYTIGVICRGTDYQLLRPAGHPIQPSPEDLFDIIDSLLERACYKYVYLTTEDIEIYQSFKRKYKEILISLPQKRVALKEKKYLADVVKENGIDTYDRNLQYLTAVVLLSKCRALVGGRTSGTVAAIVMSEGFSDMYLWNDGRYGEEID